MKKILLLTTVMLAPLAANATDKFYMSATGEYMLDTKASGNVTAQGTTVTADESFKNSFSGLIAGGYYLTDNVRTELEGGYRQFKGSNATFVYGGNVYGAQTGGTVKALTAMGNIYYNTDPVFGFSPYIGVGLGGVREQDSGSYAAAYQGMVGIDYKLTQHNTIFAGYRYFGTGDVKFASSLDGVGTVTGRAGATTQALDVGYRYSF